MKKLKLLLIGLIMLVVLPFNINAAKKEPITVHMFRGEGCGYCAAALEFFDSIEDQYGKYFNLETHEVWSSEENAAWMQRVAEYFNEEANGVPYIIIGEKTFPGYSETYNDDIIKAIKSSYNSGEFVDVVNQLKDGSTTPSNNKTKKDSTSKTTIIIIIVALVGFIALIYFARDTEIEEEIVNEVKKEKKTVKPVETKKTTTKKTTKKTTPKKNTKSKSSKK